MARRPTTETYADWLRNKLDERELTPSGLAEQSGVSAPAIYNILNSVTTNPQSATRDKIEKALDTKPSKSITAGIEAETKVEGLGDLEEFYPHDPNEAPQVKGVYVFYDAFDRPAYVGKAIKQDIRKRIDQHRDKFWFRDPIVTKARFIRIDDASLCGKIELLLIRFLGSHNFLNKRGAEKYRPDDIHEDT